MCIARHVAALELARTFDPGVTLVISDGQPDRIADALAIARTFRGAIDALYVGHESDALAMDFMRRLAKAARGEVRSADLSDKDSPRLLLQHIAASLAPPKSE